MQKKSWTSQTKRILIFACHKQGKLIISILISILLSISPSLILLIRYYRFGERTLRGQLGMLAPTMIFFSVFIFIIIQYNISQRFVTFSLFEKLSLVISTLILAFFTAKAFPISEPSLVTIHSLDIYQQNNSKATSTMIVKEIRTPDDQTVSFFDLIIKGQYQILDEKLIMVNDDSMSIRYHFPASLNQQVKVLFNSNSYGGIVSVDVDDQENIINLYEPESSSDKLVTIPVLNHNLSSIEKNSLWLIDSMFYAFLYLLFILNFDWHVIKAGKFSK